MAMASMPACAATEFVAKGRGSAAVLKAMLGQLPAVVGAGATTPHGLRDLAEQILRCCERATELWQPCTAAPARRRLPAVLGSANRSGRVAWLLPLRRRDPRG